MRGAVWDLWSSVGMDRVDRLSEGTRKRNSEGTRMTRKICWFFGCSGVPATCVQEESARSSRWEKLRGSDLKSSNFPSQQTGKKRVSLAILFVLLPLPKFKLLNLQRFHLYTCKTTLCLVFAVFNGLFSLLCVTLDSPLMVFLTFLRMYNLQSHIDSLACVARQVSQRCRATATWMQTATW